MAVLFRDFIYMDAEMERASRGDILVEGDRIAAIGPGPGELAGEIETVQGKGRTLLIPGLVNGHTHAAMVLLRGLGEELPLKRWLEERIWPVEAGLVPEHIYWGTRGAIMEMVSTGTTCFSDMYFEMDEVAKAATETGVRCCICRGLTGDDPVKVREGVELFRRWNGKGNIRVQLGPHAPYTVSLGALKEIVGSAADLGSGVHFHFLEAEWEEAFIRDRFGLSPLAYLEEAGLLETRGTVLAHCVWFPEGEVPELAGTSVTVAHNPTSNMKLGSGHAPLQSFLETGVPVSLGTDGAASNNRLDIWGEMRLCALIHKGISKDPTAIAARDIFRMATLSGASAACFEKLGLIREGWQADLVMVDLDRPHYIGWDPDNLIGFLVYAGSSSDILGTMAAGRWLFRDGEFPGQDRGEVMGEISRCRDDLLGRALRR